MRTIFAAILLWLMPAIVYAQAAPVPPPAKHVDPAQGAAAQSQASQAAQTAQQGTAPANQAKVLDSVVAIINGDVLLESDVEDEQRFELLQLLPESQNTRAGAAQRLIARTLILQEMKAQNTPAPDITDAAIEKSLDQLRAQLPGCAHGRCATASGWAAFLGEHGLTPEEVHQRWRQRLVILNYLDLRFRSGIRIPKADIDAYYQKTIVTEFDKKHAQAPPLKTLSPKIQEILLQQQVNQQIGDWIKTLRQQGSVKILVPEYGVSTSSDDDDNSGGGA
jgi:hypothetical protein